jgi:DNA polymerase-3 subunit beta
VTARFTVARDPFAAALARAHDIVPDRMTIPVLSCVKIDAGPHGLVLTATDMDVALTEQVDAEACEAWSGCVEIKRLAGFAKALPRGGELVVEADDHRIEVRQDRAVARLPVTTVDDFPVWRHDDGDATLCEIAGGELAAALRMLGHAMSAEEQTRPYLRGVCLHAGEDGSAIGCATDSYRLALRRLPITLPPDMNIIVPRETVTRLLALLRGFADAVRMRLSPRATAFACGAWTLHSRLINGTYPQYQRVLPWHRPEPVVVERAALADAVERVRLVAGEARTTAVKLLPADGLLGVSAAAEGGLGDGEETIVARSATAGAAVGVNGRFLKELLGALPDATEVELHIGSPVDPIWICGAGETHDGIVLMPMRV